MNPLLQSVQIALQNAEQKEAITFINKVVDFCIAMENGKVLDGATRDYIQTLVAYHIAKDTITSESDASGNILGVFMWYNCNEDEILSQLNEWKPDRKDGDTVLMASIFAKDKQTFKKIIHNFILKCPEVSYKKLRAVRYKSGVQQVKSYTTKLFRKILTQ
jgi:hypothetical protein